MYDFKEENLTTTNIQFAIPLYNKQMKSIWWIVSQSLNRNNNRLWIKYEAKSEQNPKLNSTINCWICFFTVGNLVF